MNLRLEKINLKYSSKIVLADLDLYFEQGKIHALLGENGAGKSSTANIICGEILPNSGSIFIDDKPVVFKTPADAINKKISYVHQTPMLAESLSIKENLSVGIKKQYLKNMTATTDIWLKNINLNTKTKQLGSDIRFFAALCSALIKNPEILILDEPTALLSSLQKDFLFENLRKMADNGMNIIVITHNMDEAENYCDTITYLENGKVCDIKELHKINIDYKKKKNINSERIIFENICCRKKDSIELKNLNFFIQKGCISLIKGLTEDGLYLLENIITAMDVKHCSGTIHFSNRYTVNLKKNDFNPRILRYKTGFSVGIIPTNKKFRGSNPNLSVEQMLSARFIEKEKNTSQLADIFIEKSKVNISKTEKSKNLSGGMLQKLLLERELHNNPELLILCNPLQGLDVDSCNHICKKISSFAENGAYILVISSGAFPSEYCDFEFKLTNGTMEQL